jgi:ABC-type polysaccharide/polyol phosphate export permease
MIFSQMIIIILTFSALGTLFGLIIPNGMTLIHIYSILFLLLSVGMGTFIPLDNYPGAYVSIIEKIPITFVFKNVQAAIINDPIQWLNYFLTIGMLFIIIVISLIITHKVFRKV